MGHSARARRAPLLVIALLFSPALSHGGIVLTTGAMTEAKAPDKALDLVGNFQIHVFPEKSNVELAAALAVDITKPGSVNKEGDLTKGQIAAKTAVDSYFVQYNAPKGFGPFRVIGSLTFDSEILGVIVLDKNLDPSDPILGLPGTRYPTGTIGRGPDFAGLAELRDVVVLSQDRRSMTFELGGSGRFLNGYDQVRIVTAATPGPANLMLAGAGSAALTAYGWWRRRRGSSPDVTG